MALKHVSETCFVFHVFETCFISGKSVFQPTLLLCSSVLPPVLLPPVLLPPLLLPAKAKPSHDPGSPPIAFD